MWQKRVVWRRGAYWNSVKRVEIVRGPSIGGTYVSRSSIETMQRSYLDVYMGAALFISGVALGMLL